jgi:uncharacterized protein YceK
MAGPVAVSGHDHVFYRGVRLDVEGAKEGGPMVLMAADIPFSAVADTLLVPYLAYHKLADSPRKNQQSLTDEKANNKEGQADSLPTSNPKQ